MPLFGVILACDGFLYRRVLYCLQDISGRRGSISGAISDSRSNRDSDSRKHGGKFDS